jgi:hypothetical protein
MIEHPGISYVTYVLLQLLEYLFGLYWDKFYLNEQVSYI